MSAHPCAAVITLTAEQLELVMEALELRMRTVDLDPRTGDVPALRNNWVPETCNVYWALNEIRQWRPPFKTYTEF